MAQRRNNHIPQDPQDTNELQSELAEMFMSDAWAHAVRHVSKSLTATRRGILNGALTDVEPFKAKKNLFERLYEAAGLELPEHLAAFFE